MRMSRTGKGWLAGFVLLGSAWPAWSAPPVSQMLSFKPLQKGVVYSTPTPQELDQCKVELVEGPNKASGWVLKDPKGSLLRKFYDSNGDKYPDQWSYYKDGAEVYREVDSNFNHKRDRYLWLNGGGMKIGVDSKEREDGTLDGWLALSIEELSQEVMKAVAAKDYRLLQTLLVTEDDLRTLGTPAREIARIRDLQKQTPAKFQQTTTKMSHLNEATRWLHLETSAPNRLPADTTGMKQDVLMYYRGTVLCETAGKHDWIQLGETVKVGDTWKLIDAPLPGDGDRAADLAANVVTPQAQDPETQQLMKSLAELDKDAPRYQGQGADPAVVRYHGRRADLMERLAAKAPEAEQALWYRQIADSLGTATQASPPGDRKAMDRLGRLAERVAKAKPGSDVAAYIAFRELSTDYALKVHEAKKAEDMLAVQTKFTEHLAKFVSRYPKAEDAADALLQLGMIHEFQGKEADAKKWYEQLAGTFPATKEGVKAAGALRRLNLVGQPWEINAPVISLAGGPFSMDKLRDRMVVVYYWASWCQSAPADFTKLKALAQEHRSQGLEVIGINVDDAQGEAESFINKHVPPGYHLHAAGGLESPLATHYGLIVFPHVMLVGRDGKVLDRAAELGTLDAELKKAIK
jgi:thiol-disulfide isomerase/thioredoxin